MKSEMRPASLKRAWSGTVTFPTQDVFWVTELPPRGNKIDSGICEPNPTIKPPIQISHSLTLDNHPDFDGDFGWRSIEEIAAGLRPSSDEEAWDRDSDSDEEELEEDEEVEH